MNSVDNVRCSLGPLEETLIRNHAQRTGLSTEAAKGASRELAKFLLLCAKSDAPLAPSEEVDDVWHDFVLHTREYHAFCRDQIGRFIHHVPSEVPDQQSYWRTLTLMEAEFGGVDERYWPRSAAPGKCCGSHCSGEKQD